MKDPDSAESHRLIARLLEGGLDDDGRAALSDQLRRSSAARKTYLEHCRMHAMLKFEHGLLAAIADDEAAAAASAPAPASAASAIAAAGMAAAAVIFSTAVWLEHGPDGPDLAAPDQGAPERMEAAEVAESPAAASERPATPILAAAGNGSQNRPPTRTVSIIEKVAFNRDIRPILSDSCFQCHGPDSAARKADLRLDKEDALFAASDDPDAPALLVRFRPEESELFRRITAHDDPDDLMPPPDSNKSLDERQISLVRRWIEEGASWQDHWAFIPPKKSALPEGDAAHPIDRFIAAELERRGLAMSPEADRATLIRRVALDLTGLPPTPEEVDAFVGDPAPDAYEQLVDRLLASPHYGEHRARYWLDAARYGDTHGLHLDNIRTIWPFRDWVVDAFNRNVPFDQFTIEQLAGDLLPDATTDQRIATGFVRCNVTTSEGGAIDEEFRVRYAADRIETTGTVWMGLTVGCAACHDHKFDPVTQREFYQLAAFFNNTTQPGMDGNVRDSPPSMLVYPRDIRDRAVALNDEAAALRADLQRRIESLDSAAFGAWLAARAGASIPPAPTDGLAEHFPLDDTAAIQVKGDGTAASDQSLPGGGRGVLFAGGATGDLGDAARLGRTSAFTLAFWVRTSADGGSLVRKIKPVDGQYRGYQVRLDGGKPTLEFSHYGRNDASEFHADIAVADGRWHHIAVVGAGAVIDPALAVYVDGWPAPLRRGKHALGGAFLTDAPVEIGGAADTAMSDLRVYERVLAPSEILAMAAGPRIADLSHPVSPAGPPAPESLSPAVAFAAAAIDPDIALAFDRLDAVMLEKAPLDSRATTTLVVEEKSDTKPIAHVLERGEYEKRGEEVAPGVPTALPAMSDDLPANRLGLARWLVSRDHPLTARVTVNRLWQQFFGAGIVRTAEDFGVQGDSPSHPELLDWLAVDFMESGWDVKRMIRRLVTSAAYRQTSNVPPQLLAADPQNRLLGRGPRYRLDAEVLRDQALAVSGLLVPKTGGPPVKPPQPGGIWEAVGYSGSNTVHFVADDGEAVYRRSLYTFWKRTAPAPSMVIFDAPNRESCTVRRERTNTPLQALVLMNEPQFVEAARVLAESILRETSGADPAEAVDRLHRRVLGKPPRPQDAAILADSARRFADHYAARPEAARQLAATGVSPSDPALDPIDVAALTMVASQILNLDEVVCKN